MGNYGWRWQLGCPCCEEGFPDAFIFYGVSTALLKTTYGYTQSVDSWTQMTDGPTPARLSSSASTIGDAAYIVAGAGASVGLLRDTEEYDPDTWTAKTDCPTPARDEHGMATISTAAYIAYGSKGGASTDLLRDTDEYSPDTWTSKTDAPVPARNEVAAFAISALYMVCGELLVVPNTYHRDNDEYAPDTWTSRTDCPAPGRTRARGFSVGGKGYIVGGDTSDAAGGDFIAQNDEYDASGDSWATRTAMSNARTRVATYSISDLAYAVAGFNSDESPSHRSHNEEYDHVGDAWTDRSAANGRYAHAGAAVSS